MTEENRKMRITTDLSGRVALVTGAGRGLGLEVAKALARSGAKIALIDVNAELLETAAATIRALGVEALPLVCDVTNSEKVNATVDEVVAKWGGLDILVNNAGVTRDTLVMRMKDEQWDMVLGINLRGTFLFTRAAARPLMKSPHGRIINMASISGQIGNPGQANYSASKAGVVGFTRTVARELAGRHITVNAVAPGFIATDMTAALSDEVREEVVKRIPLGCMGQPQDVAEAVLYLASDAASFITGHLLTVDGGLTA